MYVYWICNAIGNSCPSKIIIVSCFRSALLLFFSFVLYSICQLLYNCYITKNCFKLFVAYTLIYIYKVLDHIYIIFISMSIESRSFVMCIHTYIYIDRYIYMYVCVFVYGCVFVYMCLFVLFNCILLFFFFCISWRSDLVQIEAFFRQQLVGLLLLLF